MVLSNYLCAEYLIKKYGNSILRTQPPSDSQTHIHDNQLVQEYLHNKSTKGAKYITLKSCLMTGEQTTHFGLNKKYYTHFTSPIRRYIDLINHWLIKEINTEQILSQLEQIVEHANQIETKIKRASKDMIYLTLINHLENNHIDEIIVKGYIIGLMTKTPSVQLKIYIPDYKLSKYVVIIHYQLKDLYTYTQTATELTITDKSSGHCLSYQLYTSITLKVTPIMNAESFTKKLRIYPFLNES
jgi:exoribonuclease R